MKTPEVQQGEAKPVENSDGGPTWRAQSGAAQINLLQLPDNLQIAHAVL